MVVTHTQSSVRIRTFERSTAAGLRIGLLALAVAVAVFFLLFFGVGAVEASEPDCADVDFDQDADGVYLVATVDELQCMGDPASETGLTDEFALVSDIDATETSGWHGENGFEPVGESGDEFNGTFDGRYHTITGLTIDRMGQNRIGLFGQVGAAGAVTNVTLEDVSIAADRHVGGVVGWNEGTVENVQVSGVLNVSVDRGGGIAGSNRPGTIRNASASVVIEDPVNYLAGLVGENRGTVEASTADSTIDGHRAGGLVGYNEGGTVRESGATGSVNGSTRVGGLIGWNFNGTVIDSWASATVTGTGSEIGGLIGESNWESTVTGSNASGDVTGEDGGVGGLVGWNEGSVVTQSRASGDVDGAGGTVGGSGGLVGWNDGTVSQSSASGTVNGSSAVGGLVGHYWNGTISDSFASGRVTATGDFNVGGLVGRSRGPIFDSNASGDVVADVDENVGGLAGNSEDRIENSHATGNVTVAGGFAVGGLAGGNSGFVNDSWTNGSVEGNQAVGGLVGGSNGYITNATASGEAVGNLNVGGLVGWNADIDGIGEIHESSASANATGGERVGGLAGQNQGVITDANASGAVTGTQAVGGLVGRLSLGENDVGVLNRTYSSASVSGQQFVGGLAGLVDQGSVSNSFATGSVDGDSSVGGFAGGIAGEVEYAYTTADVEGTTGVGGFVGVATEEDGVVASISQVYAAGSTAGDEDVGGFVGNHMEGDIWDSYWDVDGTGQVEVAGAGDPGDDPAGLYAPEMGGQAGVEHMDAFDFDTTWNVVDDSADGYTVSHPYLQALDDLATVEPPVERTLYAAGDGTASTPYELATWRHLHNVRANLDSNFSLVAGLDATTIGYDDHAGPAAYDGAGFSPIGDSPFGVDPAFTGTFDGGGQVVGDVWIDRPVANNVGLFGGLEAGGTITAIQLENATVIGNARVGALVGWNEDASVEESVVIGSVEGNDEFVGGAVGRNSGFISDLGADVAVTGMDNNTGGLVGANWDGTITDSVATGDVTGVGEFIGGLAGGNTGEILHAGAHGDVHGEDEHVGGLVGVGTIIDIGEGPSVILNSTATGNVSADGQGVGGLIGGLDAGTVEHSTASGTVTGPDWVGGLAGASQGTIRHSTATGEVVADEIAGGLIGFHLHGLVETASAVATVEGNGSGGLVGNNLEGTIVDSTAEGDVTGVVTGGLVAVNNEGTVSNTTASGSVTGIAPDAEEDLAGGGGLVGINVNGTVESSSASGAVDHVVNAGGLLGGNLGAVVNSTAVGDVNGSENTGGLVGINIDAPPGTGTIIDSTATGNVTGYMLAGGLAGGNNGGIVIRSSASGSVSGEVGVGGLLGMNAKLSDDGGEAVDSYATGAVSGNLRVGGLVGQNAGDLRRTYTTSSVSANHSVGGLVGTMMAIDLDGGVADPEMLSSGTVEPLETGQEPVIEQAYAAGPVSGATEVGGFIGNATNGSVSAGYWDVDATGQSVGVGTGSADVEPVGLTTLEMLGDSATTSMDGLSFNPDWDVVDRPAEIGQEVSYPYLVANHQVPEPGLRILVDVHFAVTITDAPEVVTVGEEVVVEYAVENLGTESDTQDIDLLVDGAVVDSQERTLDGGDNTTGAFTYETGEDDAPEIEVIVASDDDQDNRTIAVESDDPAEDEPDDDEEPDDHDKPFFEIAIEAPPASVTAGTTVDIIVNVTNSGNATATQTITVTIDQTNFLERNVTLEPGESTMVTADWVIEPADVGFRTITATTANASAERQITVESAPDTVGPDFRIAITEAPISVTRGENVSIGVTISNLGDAGDTQVIRGTVSEQSLYEESLDLTAGGNAVRDVTWETADVEPGEYVVAFESDDDRDEVPITVESAPEPSNFTVNITALNESLVIGDRLVVTAEVTNTGDVEDTGTVTVEFDDRVLETRELTLAGGGSETLTVPWDVTDVDPGEHQLSVATPDETDTRSIEVLAIDEAQPGEDDDDDSGMLSGVDATNPWTLSLTAVVLIAIVAGLYYRRRKVLIERKRE